MDRRSFIGSCTAGAACLPLSATLPVFAADGKPRSHARSVLVDELGKPLRASSLQEHTNYLFHYPFQATPVFLLNLGKTAAARRVDVKEGGSYHWPGGVGPRRSIVAYSAICSHQLVYPNRELSFISYRKDRSARGVQAGLIHCCADHSQYDPAGGAAVLAGPAPRPLAAVLLEHDPATDTLTAHATLGGEMFPAFFKKYEARLQLDSFAHPQGPVGDQTRVHELGRFTKNNVQC
jgi:arsenite oxidase small subunit